MIIPEGIEGKKCEICNDKWADGKTVDGKYVCMDCLFSDESLKEHADKVNSEAEIVSEIKKTENEIKGIVEKMTIYEESGQVTKEDFDKLKPQIPPEKIKSKSKAKKQKSPERGTADITDLF